MFDNGLQKVYVIFQEYHDPDSDHPKTLIFHSIYRDADTAVKEVDRLNDKEEDDSFFYQPQTVRI